MFIICEHERTQRPLEPVAIPGLATTPQICHESYKTPFDYTKSR